MHKFVVKKFEVSMTRFPVNPVISESVRVNPKSNGMINDYYLSDVTDVISYH